MVLTCAAHSKHAREPGAKSTQSTPRSARPQSLCRCGEPAIGARIACSVQEKPSGNQHGALQVDTGGCPQEPRYGSALDLRISTSPLIFADCRSIALKEQGRPQEARVDVFAALQHRGASGEWLWGSSQVCCHGNSPQCQLRHVLSPAMPFFLGLIDF